MTDARSSVLERALEAKHELECKEAEKDLLLHQELHNLRIEELVGKGGFGAVYRAIHTRLETSFAVKVLHAQIEEHPELVARFEREAKASAMLHHPNIIRVSDFGQLPDGRYYLIMDFLTGQSLKQALGEGEAFSEERIRWLMDALCDALSYIHDKHMTHRDIKPSNIYLEREPGQQREHVILIDFGIAALAHDHSLTQPGTRLGTPTYMSPEQARGRSDEADGRADLYAVGVILFQLLTGVAPFAASSHPELLYKHIHEAPPTLGDVRPEVDWAPSLEAMVRKSLAKEPDERYPDAAALLASFHAAMDAQQALGPLPDRSRPPASGAFDEVLASMPTEVPAAPSRPQLPPWLYLAVGGCLLAAVATAWWLGC